MRLERRWFAPFLVLAVSACGDEAPPNTPTPTPVAVVRVDIDGSAQQEIGTPGGTLQLRALATLADGTRPDVTGEAAWSVTDARVLTVSSRGLVTGVADGGTIVTAVYRERAGVTNVRVGPAGGRPFPITGVVVDAERGTPMAGVALVQGSGEFEHTIAVTDDNGFFDLGDRSGQIAFSATRFGYQDERVNVGTIREPIRVDVRLRPNPGAYIERQMTGAFTKIEGNDSADATLRIVTRAGGVFDAIVRSSSCGSGASLGLFAENGASLFFGRPAPCNGARVSFVVTEPDILLTIRGHDATGWQLTFREPR